MVENRMSLPPNKSSSNAILPSVLVAVWALGGCGMVESIKDSPLGEDMFPWTPTQAVEYAFASYDPDMRRKAVAMLAAAPFSDDEAYEKYVRMNRTLLRTEPNPSVQAVLVMALGMHGDSNDAVTVATYLANTSNPRFVRWEAAKALRKLHNPQVLDELIQAASEDDDADVRMAATDALGQYPQPSVFETLLGRLDDAPYGNFGVMTTAGRSLHKLTGQDFGIDSAKWRQWRNENQADLFKNQQVYTFQPYNRPSSMVQKIQFWKKTELKPPRTATGTDVGGSQQQQSPGSS